MTLMVDSGLILLGEIRRQSLLRVETQERTRLIVGNYLDQVSLVNNGFMTSVKIPINLFFFCLVTKMLNKEFGGTVMKKDIREDGQFNINVETSSALFRLVEVYV